MVLRSLLFLSLVLSLISCSGNNETVASGNNEDVTEVSGKTLFEQNCAACHGNDGKLGASGAKDLTNSTMKDDEIIEIIRVGKNGMPPMEALLGTEDNIAAVTNYVKSMRK